MYQKIITNSILLVIVIIFTTLSPSWAVEEAPEIPTGFGPIIINGIVLSIAAIKSLRK